MIRALTGLVVVAAIAACGPAPTPMLAGPPTAPAPEVTAAQTPEACAAAGGTIQPVCRRQTEVCVIAYADAGKPCTDGYQCQGDCRAEPSDGPPKPGTVTGVCQADSDPCGCFTTIEDGQIAHAICVD